MHAGTGLCRRWSCRWVECAILLVHISTFRELRLFTICSAVSVHDSAPLVQNRQPGAFECVDVDIEVCIPPRGSRQSMSPLTVFEIAKKLNTHGVVLLRGSSLFSEVALEGAHAAVEAALQRVQLAAAAQQVVETPWSHTRGQRQSVRFQFQEAVSFSPGRLDLPTLLGEAPFNTSIEVGGWRDRSDLLALCKQTFDGEECRQRRLGALYNFPSSFDTDWHRDGMDEIMTIFTATDALPANVGWPKFALVDRPECHVNAVLAAGESVIFKYETMHAPTPNHGAVPRMLVYSLYGTARAHDRLNYPADLPSLFAGVSQ